MSARWRAVRLWREVVALLHELGARPIRTRGSHQTWAFPNNERFTVVCNHLGDTVPRKILATLRRLLARRSPSAAEPPPLAPWLGLGDPIEAAATF